MGASKADGGPDGDAQLHDFRRPFYRHPSQVRLAPTRPRRLPRRHPFTHAGRHAAPVRPAARPAALALTWKGVEMITLLVSLVILALVFFVAWWAVHRLAAAFGAPAVVVTVLEVILVVVGLLALVQLARPYLP